MRRFYVYRRGYNAANNSFRDGGPETVQVREVEAETADAAVQIALDDGVTVYNDQMIWAEDADAVDRKKPKGRVIR